MDTEVPLAGLRDSVSGRPAPDILAEIAGAIRGGSRFLVAGHANPDGDALGSAVALALGLRSLGKDAVVVEVGDLPPRYRAFAPPDVVVTADSRWISAAAGRFDWCAVLDTSERSRLGPVERVIFAPGQRRFCLDHHLHVQQGLFDHHLVVEEVPATATLVLAILDVLGVPLDRDMARMLWLALSSDTGWFRFSNTGPLALRDAARLLGIGLDPEALYEQIYGSHRIQRMRLFGDALAGLRTDHGGRFAWAVVTQRSLAARDVSIAELEGFIDHFKSIDGVEVVALISEVDGGSFKVSLRATGRARVDGIARGFGGGGHAKAAGFRHDGPIEELEAALRRAVVEGFAAAPMVRR